MIPRTYLVKVIQSGNVYKWLSGLNILYWFVGSIQSTPHRLYRVKLLSIWGLMDLEQNLIVTKNLNQNQNQDQNQNQPKTKIKPKPKTKT